MTLLQPLHVSDSLDKIISTKTTYRFYACNCYQVPCKSKKKKDKTLLIGDKVERFQNTISKIKRAHMLHKHTKIDLVILITNYIFIIVNFI